MGNTEIKEKYYLNVKNIGKRFLEHWNLLNNEKNFFSIYRRLVNTEIKEELLFQCLEDQETLKLKRSLLF